MLAALLVASTVAIVIAPPGGADEGCPSPRQVTDALQARLPWAMLPPGQTAPASAFRLAIASAPGGARVQLSDASGEPVLVRALPPAAHNKIADCAALADTTALIVERYLHDVGYEAPPLPPTPPPPATVERAPPPPTDPPLAPARAAWRIGLGVEGRYGDTQSAEGSALLSLGFDRPLGGRRRAGVRIAGGVGPSDGARWNGDQAHLRRIPLRAGAYLGVSAGPGWLEPGLDAGLDLLLVSVTPSPTTNDLAGGNSAHMAPFVSAGLGYLLPLARHLYLRPIARGGVAVPYRFVATPDRVEVLSTPRTYLELGLESGVSFP